MINGFAIRCNFCCSGVADYVTSDNDSGGDREATEGQQGPVTGTEIQRRKSDLSVITQFVDGPGDKNAKWPTLFIQTVLHYCMLWEVIL